MPGSLRAFLDASVLYPVSLRHLLMRLTLAQLFQARWSATVHEEWIRAVLRDNPGVPITRLQTCGTPWMSGRRTRLLPVTRTWSTL